MDSVEQGGLLDSLDRAESFAGRLKSCSMYPLRALSVDVLQVNITRKCNLACRHCHVEASPGREEEMERRVMEACLAAASHPGVSTLDITGGAPETHPDFEWFVREASRLEKRLLVRTNAAILSGPAYSRFIRIYAEAGVEVVASLPGVAPERTDRIRGPGVFGQIIGALRALNAAGYAVPGTGLVLDLVHNPAGAFLPGAQRALEDDYRSRLRREHGVEFNRLFCLANFPVGRFLDFLARSGNLDEYADLIRRSFNPASVGGVMCRTTVSVGCDGRLFDCDFNQALGESGEAGAHGHIRDFDFEKLSCRTIKPGFQCYACTAGAGSSCQGALEK